MTAYAAALDAAAPLDPPPFGLWERTLAGRYLRAKRAHGGVALISIISFIGVMLAVFVLIVVMSVMNGFRTQLLDKILGVQPHIFVNASGLSPEEADAIAAQLTEEPGILSAEAYVGGQSMATANGGVAGVIVNGVPAESLRRLELVAQNLREGSLDTFGEGEFGGDEIVIGQRLADQLALRVGDDLTLIAPTGDTSPFGTVPRRKAYYVSAIFDVGMSDYDGVFVYMPIEQARKFFKRGDATDVIRLRVEDADEIDRHLPAVFRIAGASRFVTDWRDTNVPFFNALATERVVMRLILMLIVAIAALNIISGLVMLVKNKGRDIAILRTMGATRGSILRVFFMAGASVGVLGTLAGLALGVLVASNIEPIQAFVEWVTKRSVFPPEVYYLTRIPAQIEWSEVFIVTGWGLFMSCVATLFPAWRAARLDPVEALRYE